MRSGASHAGECRMASPSRRPPHRSMVRVMRDHEPTPEPDRVALWGGILLAVGAILLGLSYGACSQDDAFISFRYADNLLRGHGLVFNPGERVEGYTNLSWTLLLAAAMGLGADPVIASILLGLLSLGALILLTAAWLGAGARGGLAVFAAALVALDPLVALEAVEGLETVAFAALGAGALGLALRGRDAAAGGVLSLACLTRPEGIHLAGLMYTGLCLDAALRPSRRVEFSQQFRGALTAAAPVVLTLVLLTLWRLAYYGDPLPNTFYAKAGGGLAVERGLLYLRWHALDRPLLYGLLALRLVAGRPTRNTVPCMVLVAGYLAYVVAVGGDFKPTGRFIIPVLPAMGLLAAETLGALHARLPRLAPLAVAGALALLLAGTASLYPGAKGIAAERHANLQARKQVGDWLAAHTHPDTVLAIHSAGVVPFYAGRTTIDMWGLADRHIAHAPPPEDFGQGMAGHEKTDPDYVFSRKPDLYLPEDLLVTLQPQVLVPDPSFPDDFEERYRARSIPLDGVWLNLWIRRGFMGGLWGR